ncbi:MAG: radical SAM family heme chaperone HemW [Desulfobulbaceae bacterium]|nr:radical SAM family heme chaperone HemW [Desulfobulbaceae bacterium]MCK5545214.1 radical SAM family heme chaperone HemW [Desulfobulbaceae bacterium]
MILNHSVQPLPPLPDCKDKTASLYVHIPFCRTKCGYCSFVSFPAIDFNLTNYMEGLLKQAETMSCHPWIRKRRFKSLFVGGGTPTIYDEKSLARLIKNCLRLFKFESEPEITVETNPNTVTLDKLITLAAAGVNRLSIGIQSFSDRLLKLLGRSHSAADGLNSVKSARTAGFTNINLDLMYGLPYQTIADWEETLGTAVTLSPEHLSIYELTVEEGTRFAERADKGELVLPHEDTVIEMEAVTRNITQKAGYQRYEISNFAKSDRKCAHNINYWENRNYVGLGAAAFSCFSGVRVQNITDPAEFARLTQKEMPPFLKAESLSNEARFRETVIMGLRMLSGVSITMAKQRFNLTPQTYYGETLQKLIENDLIQISGDHMRLTEKGLPLANQVMAQLV